jgi:hypothetical protein
MAVMGIPDNPGAGHRAAVPDAAAGGKQNKT